jgi:uncharacterized membrane protein HdeD (DUF308 family)
MAWDARHDGVIRAVVLIVLGAAAIAFPLAASVTSTYVVAWLLVLAGLTHFLFAWRGEGGAAVLWRLLVGAVYMFAGFAIFWHPLWGTASLVLVLCAALIVEGTMTLLLYFLDDNHSGWMLFNGVVTLALASLVASGTLFGSLSFVGTIIGINILITGVARLATWMEGERLNRLRAS